MTGECLKYPKDAAVRPKQQHGDIARRYHPIFSFIENHSTTYFMQKLKLQLLPLPISSAMPNEGNPSILPLSQSNYATIAISFPIYPSIHQLIHPTHRLLPQLYPGSLAPGSQTRVVRFAREFAAALPFPFGDGALGFVSETRGGEGEGGVDEDAEALGAL